MEDPIEEPGKVNPAFEVDTEQKDTDSNSLHSGVPAAAKSVIFLEEKVTTLDDEDPGPQRQQWTNETEFVMSCIAMAVGIGNIWRFPFVAFDNGGGAFLIPYLIVLFLIGKPMYYLEVCIGQFVSGGPVQVWALSPALKGIGYGQMFATSMLLLYYCSLMAIACFYFVNSFAYELPWSVCRDEWNGTCFDANFEGNRTGLQSASSLFFYNYLLNEPANIDDGIGDPNWRLIIGLGVFWMTIFLVVLRGVQSSGKAAYFLALFPYVIMIALLIRGVTLDGAVDGIAFFFQPQWEKLLEPTVWQSAVTQAFFSLGIGFGTLIMYASYNGFKQNAYRSSMIVTTLDTFTSLLAGTTIFAILGNLAHEMGGADITEVVAGGPGLAFVSYPEAISRFDAVPQLFAVLFFGMLFVLGVGTAVALLSAVITVIRDDFPHLNYLMVAVVCTVLGFVGGLVYVTPGGLFILTLVDFYGATFPVFILGTCEIIGIAWIYGVNNLCDDLEFMLNRKEGIYWRLCWWFVTPVLMIIILIYYFINVTPVTYRNIYYPTEAYVAGWVLFGFAVGQLPLWMCITIYKRRRGTFLETIKSAFQVSELWRPQKTAIYKDWKEFKARKRAELEIIRREESLWQKFVRNLTGYSPLRSKIVQSSETQNKF